MTLSCFQSLELPKGGECDTERETEARGRRWIRQEGAGRAGNEQSPRILAARCLYFPSRETRRGFVWVFPLGNAASGLGKGRFSARGVGVEGAGPGAPARGRRAVGTEPERPRAAGPAPRCNHAENSHRAPGPGGAAKAHQSSAAPLGIWSRGICSQAPARRFASLCSVPPVPPRSDPLGAHAGTFLIPVPRVLYLHPQTFSPRSLLPPRIHTAAAEAALARIISLLRLKRCCLINCRLRGVVVRRLRSPVSPPRTGCRFADGTRSRPTGAEKGFRVRFTPRWPRPVQTAAERRRRFPGAISDRQLMNLGENTRPDLLRPRELPGGRIPDRRLRHPPEPVSGDFRLWWRRIRVQGSPVVPPPWVLGSTRFLCVV